MSKTERLNIESHERPKSFEIPRLPGVELYLFDLAKRPGHKLQKVAQEVLRQYAKFRRGAKGKVIIPLAALKGVSEKDLAELNDRLEYKRTLAGEETQEIKNFKETRESVKGFEYAQMTKRQREMTLRSRGNLPQFEKERSVLFNTINEALQKLVLTYGFKRPVRLEVVRSGRVDAFVIGVDREHDIDSSKEPLTVFIDPGLILYLAKNIKNFSVEHVAGVLSHELRHLLQSQKNLDKSKDDTSKRLEYDADAEAMLKMDRAGFNPRAMIETLSAIKGGDYTDYFSNTHPVTEHRVTELLQQFNQGDNTYFSANKEMTPWPAETEAESGKYLHTWTGNDYEGLAGIDRLLAERKADALGNYDDYSVAIKRFRDVLRQRLEIGAGMREFETGEFGLREALLHNINQYCYFDSQGNPVDPSNRDGAIVQPNRNTDLLSKFKAPDYEVTNDGILIDLGDGRGKRVLDQSVWSQQANAYQPETVNQDGVSRLKDFIYLHSGHPPIETPVFTDWNSLFDVNNPLAVRFWHKTLRLGNKLGFLADQMITDKLIIDTARWYVSNEVLPTLFGELKLEADYYGDSVKVIREISNQYKINIEIAKVQVEPELAVEPSKTSLVGVNGMMPMIPGALREAAAQVAARVHVRNETAPMGELPAVQKSERPEEEHFKNEGDSIQWTVEQLLARGRSDRAQRIDNQVFTRFVDAYDLGLREVSRQLSPENFHDVTGQMASQTPSELTIRALRNEIVENPLAYKGRIEIDLKHLNIEQAKQLLEFGRVSSLSRYTSDLFNDDKFWESLTGDPAEIYALAREIDWSQGNQRFNRKFLAALKYLNDQRSFSPETLSELKSHLAEFLDSPEVAELAPSFSQKVKSVLGGLIGRQKGAGKVKEPEITEEEKQAVLAFVGERLLPLVASDSNQLKQFEIDVFLRESSGQGRNYGQRTDPGISLHYKRLLSSVTGDIIPDSEAGQKYSDNPNLIESYTTSQFRESMSFEFFLLAQQNPEFKKLFEGDEPIGNKEKMAVGRWLLSHKEAIADSDFLTLITSVPPEYLVELLQLGPKDSQEAKKFAVGLGFDKKKLPVKAEKIPVSSDNKNFYYLAVAGKLKEFEKLIKSQKPEDLEPMLKMWREAQRIHGQRWQEQSPNEYAAMRELIDEVIWSRSNPLVAEKLVSRQSIDTLTKSPLIERLYFDIGRDKKFSWHQALPLLGTEGGLEDLIENPLLGDNNVKIFLINHGRDPLFVKIRNELTALNMKLLEIKIKYNPDIDLSDASDLKLIDYTSYERQGGQKEAIDKLHSKYFTADFEGKLNLSPADYAKAKVEIDDVLSQIRELINGAYQRILTREVGVLRKQVQSIFQTGRGLDVAKKFPEGFFRDYFTANSLKGEDDQSAEVLERYLADMELRVSDGMKANRTQDLIGQTIKEKYLELKSKKVYSVEDLESGGHLKSRKEREDLRENSEKYDWPESSDLYLFSEGVYGKGQVSGTLVDNFSPKIIARLLNGKFDVMQIGSVEEIQEYTGEVSRFIKEPCAFRDFFLLNAMNLRIAGDISGLGLEGIGMKKRSVDLRNHFVGKAVGVLEGAHMTQYPLLRVEGLYSLGKRKIPDEVRHSVIESLQEFIPLLSAPEKEFYNVLLFELQKPELEVGYQKAMSRAELQSADPEQRESNEQKLFQTMIDRVTETFRLATLRRDQVLRELVLPKAGTPEQLAQVEILFYNEVLRNPQEKEEDSQAHIITGMEQMKNYLEAFPNLAERQVIVSWLFGGELPDDRFLEGSEFKVDPDEKRKLFWGMTPAERRSALYYALRGNNGLFEEEIKNPDFGYYHGGGPDDTSKLKMILNNEYETFIEGFYSNNIEPLMKGENERSAEVIKTIYTSIFDNYSTPRRIELFFSVVEKLADARAKNTKLGPGEIMKIFLEGVGMVGVKVGQVISEQKGMLPEKFQSDLASLKDKTEPFGKDGMFSYLTESHLLADKSGEGMITRVEGVLGAASIKQVQLVRLTDGTMAVAKVPRPTIDRNYPEDLTVLQKVLDNLKAIGVAVPDNLLEQISDVCNRELDFGNEASIQTDFHEIISRRTEALSIGGLGDNVRLDTPQILKLISREQSGSALQLIIETYAPGITLAGIEKFRAFSQVEKLDSKDAAWRDDFIRNVQMLYPQEDGALDRLNNINIEDLRASVAFELLEEICNDGLFHADLHAGNIIIDADKENPKLNLIDLGSAGYSLKKNAEGQITEDSRPDYRAFVRSFFLSVFDASQLSGMGEIMNRHIRFPSPEIAQQIVQTNFAKSGMESAGFFKGLLHDIMQKADKIDPEFQLLLKSMATAGGHFGAIAPLVATELQSMFSGEAGVPTPTLKKLKTILNFDEAKLDPDLAAVMGRV